MESGLLTGIKRDLLAPNVIEEIRRFIKQSMQSLSRGTAPNSERLALVEREVANLVDAVASGALRTSPAVAERRTVKCVPRWSNEVSLLGLSILSSAVMPWRSMPSSLQHQGIFSH